jgi:BirA family transcriptional regulator, biotin operon repressor / biotin---[acetyl-CoA-carboxylase] ligase
MMSFPQVEPVYVIGDSVLRTRQRSAPAKGFSLRDVVGRMGIRPGRKLASADCGGTSPNAATPTPARAASHCPRGTGRSRTSRSPSRADGVRASWNRGRTCTHRYPRYEPTLAGLPRRIVLPEWHRTVLTMVTDMDRSPLDAAELNAGLEPPFRRLEVVAETGSTNADLLARAAAGADVDGLVLAAEYQSAGRGRLGRSWSAPAGAQIAMSFGVAVDAVDARQWGWLPLLTGVGVVAAVRRSGDVEAGLKWPNDILVGTKKLAGILVEVASPRPVLIVGLGLNVSLTAAEVPDPIATSLAMLGSSMTDRNRLLGNILRELGVRIDRWRSAGGADPELSADYRRVSLTLGTKVRATLPGGSELVGVAEDVDQWGRLRIDTGDQLVTVSAGDITHLRTAL